MMPKNPTILYADDDPEWRTLVSLWLVKAGFILTVVNDGKSVLPAARVAPPDCFLLDHDLGDTTGHQVCKDIKTEPAFKAKPVIIMTAHSERMLKMISDTPPEHFVVKDNNPDELLLVLGSVFPEMGL